ncbi:MAG: hypothetical protein JNK04_03005, partial [Myxococcales bacterium]|nr:hypothetical protein [Myxococcales bacterium]
MRSQIDATDDVGCRFEIVTQPRQIVPGRTYLLTRRSTQRLFLLRPDEKTNQIVRYCLGEALDRFGMELHCSVTMSNHYHLVVTDVRGCLPDFLRHLNLMTAKALNARWGRWENLWSVEQPCATWLVDDDDKLAKSVYTLVNPTVDDLVDRIEDWPGVSSWEAHVRGKAITVERPIEFFRKDGRMPERVTITVVAPRRANGERWALDDWNEKLIAAVRASEDAARVWRQKRCIRVLGRRAIRKQSAFDGPQTREARRRLRPSLACRDRERRVHELRVLRAFRTQHRAASKALLSGDRA